MAIGILWALFAPLSLVAAVFAVAFVVHHLGGGWWIALLAGVVSVMVPVGWIWYADHRAFEDICRRSALAVVHQQVPVAGFFLDSPTANSFGLRYLQEDGFSFIEARDIARRDGWVRYARDPTGRVVTSPIDHPSARFSVHERFTQPSPSVGLATTTVTERESGRELASAGSATFDGGRLEWFLGAWGVDSCPNPRSSPESFERYYHLGRDTIGRYRRPAPRG